MDARILLFSQNLHTLSGGARLGKDRQKRQRERAPRAGPKTVPHLGHGMGQGLDVSLPQCLTSMEKDRWGPSKMTSRMRQLVVSKGFFIKRLFIKQRHRTAACLKANARVIATYFSSSLQSTQVSFSKPLSTCYILFITVIKNFQQDMSKVNESGKQPSEKSSELKWGHPVVTWKGAVMLQGQHTVTPACTDWPGYYSKSQMGQHQNDCTLPFSHYIHYLSNDTTEQSDLGLILHLFL